MKTRKKRFETVPLAEVWQKAIEIDGKKPAEKVAQKDQPYSVEVKDAAESSGTAGR